MAQYWLNVAILRIILPATFTACVIWRPTGLSLIYLILAIISPFIPIPTPITLRKSTGVYFKICIAVSVIALLAQVSFQIVLLSIPSIFDEFRQSCTLLEKIFRHVGLVQLDHATPFMIFFWWLPEMITLPITSIMYYVCRHTTVEPTQEDPENFNLHQSRLSLRKTADANAKIVNFLGKIGTYIVLISLCYTASLSPSVEAGLYFIIFLSAATWWACYKELTRGFAAICRIVMFIVIFHILVLMIYQNQWPQEFIPDRSSWARYFALQSYYTTNCTDPRDVAFTWKGTEWIGYAYALRLFWLYYVLALQSQFLFRKPNIEEEKMSHLTEKIKNLDTQLSRHVSLRRRIPSQRWQSARRKARKSADASVTQPNERTPLMKFSSGRSGIIQDSTGSVIVQDGQQEEGIQMQTVNEDIFEDDTENSGGAIEQVFMAVFSIFQLIGNSSYLATNILMMAWSIMYHSWTTFVFLLWALILWMAPNKRSFMMKCSPLIVVYGTILLIVGFIYSMDLTENELPSSIYNVSMAEIGFPKSSDISRWHLIVKCGFMTMFWITMRQYMAERQQQRNISVLRDIVAPVHVSVSAATTIPNNTQTEIKSKFMRDVGMLVKKLLTKLWIVVVAIMLFASGITGERMTVFRIIYMTLFLFFVISFQISWSAWRKMMYGFWITVIGYSVIMLILVYTYQFPKFPIYWKYLHINEKLQQDIGLEAYQTKDLFVRLLTPTFFVIITVLQIHYFHDDFLETTNMENITVRAVSKKDKSGRSTSVPGETSMADVLLSEDDDYSANSPKYTLKQLKYMSKMERITFLRRTLRQIRSFYNYVWLFLEIHIQKIIFISLFLLCIDDVCAINLIFLTIVVIMINFKRSIQLVAINSMAVAIAFLVVTKMLYQITYINHSVGDQNCTIEKLTENGTEYHIKTYNIAEWIGLTKAPTGKLAFLLKDYIGIVIVTTIRGVIMVRQCFHRYSRGEPLDTPQLMFPAITRADADKGIAECLKFFLDYGFYKFGVEFCLMCIVALIGTRLDVYSVIYAVWLVIIFSPTRRTIAKIWPFFQVFMIILIPIQYAFVIGPPTWLCINYPWYTSQYLEKLQEWMYLPDAESPPNAQKLICDFILLFMVVRQNLVFKIETKCTNEGSEFIAGHNYSVHRDFDKPNFVNPVKDYVSHVHSWLDIVKRGTMMSFFWITLSIMFLAGTKRTTLFSLGYLVGAFIFLWQGSDFYLRPVNVILKWWNLLIGYNVIVILCKALLQGVGCVLMEKLQTEVCWLTQLLGISCLTMPAPSTPETNPLFDCQVEVQDIGMVWDGLCFACLIIQKRLFKTYYFFHIIDETKAMSILASRGGELLENIHRKRIEVQENIEKNILQKIKLKMDKIKADQQRIQGPSYREPTDHKVGVAPLARTSSADSCISSGHTPPQGYRTPIPDDDGEISEDLNDERRDEVDEDALPLTPRAASLLQAPSPNSAILTVSLDGYLEPTRISFGSPPSSDLNPRGISPDETFPVFSPSPYDPPPNSYQSNRSRDIYHRRQSSLAATTWLSDIPTEPRRSIVSFNSPRSPRSHQTYSLYPRDRPLYRQRAPKTNREAIRSGDYYMFDDFDDDDTTNIVPELDMEVDEDDLRRQRQTSRRMTVSELMTTVLKTDIDIATHVAMYGGTTKDALRMRRQSVPLSRKKSSMSYLSARSESPDETDVMDDTSPKKSRSEKSDPTDSTTAPADDKDSPLDDDKASTITGSDRKKKISLMIYFTFLLQFINSFIVSATKYINKFSRDYRQIRKTLAKEKEELKAKPDFRVGTRLGINQIWQPIPIVKERVGVPRWLIERIYYALADLLTSPKRGSSMGVPHIRILAPSLERGLDESSSSEILSAQRDESIEPELSEVDQPPIIQLAASVWFGILAHSTFMCYFMIFLHQIKNHSILSTPLPLMVFCWGSLTIPRPSKTFWVTIIAYTEAIVIVKCICQLDIIPWVGELGKKPLDVQSILGVEQDSNYALWDLLLLLVVFFHRFMLKSMGQWSTPSYTRKIIPENPPGQLSRRNSHEEPTRFTLINENNRRTTSQNLSTSIAPPPPPVESETNATSARDVDGDEEPLVEVKIIETNVCNQKLSSAVTMTAKKYLSPSKAFFDDLLNPDGKEKTNVYAYMFLCDFFNFLLIIFKFQSFGPQQDDDDDVTVYLQENRVPILFLIMMLVQFALIVIDRALYLRKSILGKLGFHYCLIFFVHIWMFFVLLYMTERAFDATLAPQIWYMIKCFYLLLAAYQLRLGYPTRILGNFLCKNYNIINYCLFKVFMLVPFLFELRALMDWIWTDTSMTMMDWFKMEDIFANVYQLKCMRGLETNYPQPRGVKKTQSSKYLVGGGMLLFIIGLIWFPLLFFALGRRAGDPNLPYDVTLTIKIGAHEPIYMMSAENESIIKYSIDEYKVMKNVYNLDKAALNFLQGYEPADVAAVRLGRSSQKIWAISPPDREKLRDDIDSNVSLPIHVIWSVSRKTDVKDSSGTTTKQRDISLPAYVNGEFNPVRKSLVALLTNNIDNGTIPTATILLENVFPKFLKVTSRTTSLVKELMDKTPKSQIDTQDLDKYLYRNVILHLSAEAGQQWWSVQESCDDTFYKNYLSRIELNSCNYIMMFLFNDKALPPTLSFISGFGILGLYTTAVILASQMIRRAFSEMAPKIMFDDMPYVDRILRLCLDIYLVRENKELALEEDLFAKLIFLYRSPETLIRWTRPPEPNEDDRDGDDDTRNDDEGGESSGLRQRVLSD